MELKCKMCGGALTVHTGEKIVTCAYCGTKQTVPQSAEMMEKEISALTGEEKSEEQEAQGLYDIFICYNEADSQGRRTVDSVLATDIYTHLSADGYQVFYAKMVPADKIGEEYDAYVSKALESAKIMIVLGTRCEHFNAEWVKDEWSRYLSLIDKGEKKVLIPAYKDMDPYDMPKEFVHLQAINMNELGFQQDLLHGIRKILPKEDSLVGKTEKERLKLYKDTVYKMDNTIFPEVLKECAEVFDSLGFYADSKEKKEECLKRSAEIEERNRKEELERKRRPQSPRRPNLNELEGVPDLPPKEKNSMVEGFGVVIVAVCTVIALVFLSMLFEKFW